MGLDFSGKVHVHSKQSGETIRARITTPDSSKTVYQDLKIMVKASDLSDWEAIIKDANTEAQLLANSGVNNITASLTSSMPANGANGTSITYAITGNATDYIDADGKLLKRPSFGNQSIGGAINFTVAKGGLSLTRSVDITVVPYTVSEIKTEVINKLTWESIRGKNAAETSTEETSGKSNVLYSMYVPEKIYSSYAGTYINITWEYEDSLSSLLGQDRLSISDTVNDDGNFEVTVYRPEYSLAYEKYNERATIGADDASFFTAVYRKCEPGYGTGTALQYGVYMRIGSLNLTYTLNINDPASSVVDNTQKGTFKLKTLSKAVSNNEVAEYVITNAASGVYLTDIESGTEYTKADIDSMKESNGYGLSLNFEIYQLGTISTADDLTKASKIFPSVSRSTTLGDLCPSFFPNTSDTQILGLTFTSGTTSNPYTWNIYNADDITAGVTPTSYKSNVIYNGQLENYSYNGENVNALVLAGTTLPVITGTNPAVTFDNIVLRIQIVMAKFSIVDNTSGQINIDFMIKLNSVQHDSSSSSSSSSDTSADSSTSDSE